MDRELLTLPEHLYSPIVFYGVRVANSLVFCVVFIIFFVFLVFFLLAFALSVLQFTASFCMHQIGIGKHFANVV
jgi:hypothetical protein